MYGHFQLACEVDHRRRELLRHATTARLARVPDHHERITTMDAFTSFVTVIGLLVLLAALSWRVSVDSREAFPTTERHQILRGIAVDAPDH